MKAVPNMLMTVPSFTRGDMYGLLKADLCKYECIGILLPSVPCHHRAIAVSFHLLLSPENLAAEVQQDLPLYCTACAMTGYDCAFILMN